MYSDLATLCIKRDSSLQDAMAMLDRSRIGIVLVVDDDWRLLGTITDGDCRRAMLDRVNLDQLISVLLARKATTAYATPITAPMNAPSGTYLQLLKQHKILHLPLLDGEQRVAGLVTVDDFVPNNIPLKAVVMAGGQGTRLNPLTEDMPKPMLPVGDRPIMEIIIQQLRDAGIKQVKVTTHHKPEKITDYFGDGSDFGVELSYVTEDRPLGTVGGLGLLETPQETTLVINGDILTQVDFRAMLAYHKEHGAELTVGVRHYDIKVPYGVVECDGPVVRRLSEKPVLGLFVNAGIYLLEPAVYRFIPNGQRFDMTDLIQRLIEEGRPVVSFPVREYWLDIGQAADYEQAQEHVKTWKPSP